MALVFLRDLLDQVVSLDLKDQEERRSVCVSFPYLRERLGMGTAC